MWAACSGVRTGDGMLCAQLLGNHAGDDVHLVHGGDRNQHIRLVHPGFHLHIVKRAIALHAQYFVALRHILQAVFLLLNQGDVVPLPAQVAAQHGAHLPRPYNDNPHTGLLW